MRKNYIFIAAAMAAAITIGACKNNNKKAQESALEDIQAQKQEVADSILAQIDTLAALVSDAASKSFKFSNLELSEKEKMIKPDYLLDPSVAGTFVTRLQKINALAYYTVEYGVRLIYDMPVGEADEAIATLASEIGYPIDTELLRSDIPVSEMIRREYKLCKEYGDIETFWKFLCALIFHTDYIIASNPELYIPKITEEGLQQFNLELEYVNNAATSLAPCDEEMAVLLKEIKEWDVLVEQSDWDAAFATGSTTARFYICNKKAIVERRNRMIE